MTPEELISFVVLDLTTEAEQELEMLEMASRQAGVADRGILEQVLKRLAVDGLVRFEWRDEGSPRAEPMTLTEGLSILSNEREWHLRDSRSVVVATAQGLRHHLSLAPIRWESGGEGLSREPTDDQLEP